METRNKVNKIAIQGTLQMAADKEAISLSRVYSYYSTGNLSLTSYMSILFLNILGLTLLACTQSVDNVFHSLGK